MRRSFAFAGALVLAGILVGCFYHRPEARALPDPREADVVETPTKVHLADGSVVVFPRGFSAERLEGKIVLYAREERSTRFDLHRKPVPSPEPVPLDSVVALEHYPSERYLSASGTLLAAPLVAFGALGAAVIIFGSCPTFYVDGGAGHQIQAEGFSYSIVQALETWDQDKLTAGYAGRERLEMWVANEALETHYLNAVEILEIDHPPGYSAYPVPGQRLWPRSGGSLLVASEPVPPRSAYSRWGHDVQALVRQEDENAYRTGAALLADASEEVVHDWLDFEVPIAPDAKDLVLVVRMRNTLLNTLLLYDLLLDEQNFEALSWLSDDLNAPLPALKFAKAYQKQFGLWVQMDDGDGFREVGRFSDTGPLAWSTRALALPLPDGPVANVRLRFLADNYEIDWVGFSFESSKEITFRRLSADRVVGSHNLDADSLRHLVADDDDHYLISYPGDSYGLEFGLSAPEDGIERSYVLRSKGYYVEWLRGDWLRSPARVARGPMEKLSDEGIKELHRRWIARDVGYEEAFFTNRIPVALEDWK